MRKMPFIPTGNFSQEFAALPEKRTQKRVFLPIKLRKEPIYRDFCVFFHRKKNTKTSKCYRLLELYAAIAVRTMFGEAPETPAGFPELFLCFRPFTAKASFLRERSTLC